MKGWTIIWCLCGCLFTMACDKDIASKTDDTPETGLPPISFSTTLARATRTTKEDWSINSLEDLKTVFDNKMGLFTLYTGKNKYNPMLSYPSHTFLHYNDLLEKESAALPWKCKHERFWPANNEYLSFFAFAPFRTAINKETNIKHYPIKWIFPKTPFLHYDPLYCIDQLNMNLKDRPDGKIKFKMKHAMARFKFRVRVDFSKEEEEYWKQYTSKVSNDGQPIYYEDLRKVGIWHTRWKVTDMRLLFLVDTFKIQNVRENGYINFLADNDAQLWQMGDFKKCVIAPSLQDIRAAIRYEDYPRGKEDQLNEMLVWKTVKDESEHNANINPIPWKDKVSIADASGLSNGMHAVYEQDIFLNPGAYDADHMRVSLSYRIILVGKLQKEFDRSNGQPRSLYEDPDADGWYWYKWDSKMIEHPQYRAFYGKIKERKKDVSFDLDMNSILPNKKYEVNLGVGVTTNRLDINVLPWEEDSQEISFDPDEHVRPTLSAVSWTIDQQPTKVTEIEGNQYYSAIKMGNNEILKGEFGLKKNANATIYLKLIPIEGNPNAYVFVDEDGNVLAESPTFSGNMDKKTFYIRNNGKERTTNKAILRMYIKYTDQNSDVVYGLNGKDGEIIITNKDEV